VTAKAALATQIYMQLASATADYKKRSAPRFSSLSDFVRQT
jgi:hypothetical protein